jgi:hypothetical protein
MRARNAALAGVLGLASIVGACAGVSHLAALQPPSEATSGVANALPTQFPSVPAPRLQLGVGVDFYTYPGQDVVAAAERTVAYVKSLHANAISISFPYFMHGATATSVYGSNLTPSPAELAEVAGLAEKAGLYVSLRPLLDETSIGGLSRTNWEPTDQTAWFASYQQFLQPYAEMAQQARIPEIIDGTEFSVFGHSALWNGLVSALRAVYTGAIVYDNNWGIPVQGNGGTGITEAVDAYQPIELPANATQQQLTAAWTTYDRTLPPGTVELEVDIAAVSGAYIKPYKISGWNETALDPSIQVNWFASACSALAAANLGGIYFWAVGLGQSTTTPPDLAEPASWVDSPGAAAVEACFERLAAP